MNASRIRALVEDRSGAIWLGTAGGLYRLDPRVDPSHPPGRVDPAPVAALLADRAPAGSDLQALRWQLVHALRDGSMPLDAPGLAEHLRVTVLNQVAIDQPVYSGLKTALR